MEFKQPRRKKTVFNSVNETIIKPKKSDLFEEDDDDLLELYSLIAQDQKNTNKKSKKGRGLVASSTKKTIKKIVQKRKKLIFASFIIVFGIIALTFILKDEPKDIAGVSTTSQTHSGELPREKPSFQILYPGNKTAENVGETVKISPPENAPVYTYLDQLNGIQINVSQQELPQNFKSNQDGELEKLAKNFQANNVIKVDSIIVYHGANESGVQSLIFIKGNLLITIRSSNTISDDTWAAYISALHS